MSSPSSSNVPAGFWVLPLPPTDGAVVGSGVGLLATYVGVLEGDTEGALVGETLGRGVGFKAV